MFPKNSKLFKFFKITLKRIKYPRTSIFLNEDSQSSVYILLTAIFLPILNFEEKCVLNLMVN